jgi:hypothetical protein
VTRIVRASEGDRSHCASFAVNSDAASAFAALGFGSVACGAEYRREGAIGRARCQRAPTHRLASSQRPP